MLGRACVAYADCQHKLGQLDGAVESLETFLQLSHSQVTVLSVACASNPNVTDYYSVLHSQRE